MAFEQSLFLSLLFGLGMVVRSLLMLDGPGIRRKMTGITLFPLRTREGLARDGPQIRPTASECRLCFPSQDDRKRDGERDPQDHGLTGRYGPDL